MNSKFKLKKCSCGCGKSYYKGKSTPAGWKKAGNSILRLSDNVLFSKGDIIQRFTEKGKQYCDMIIRDIDFYMKDSKSRLKDTFYIRASSIKTGDLPEGSTNITDELTDYESADNPNLLRFIKK